METGRSDVLSRPARSRRRAAPAGSAGVAVRERGRTIASAAGWWSIEVLHGEVSAFRWQEQYDSALIEAALALGMLLGGLAADGFPCGPDLGLGAGRPQLDLLVCFVPGGFQRLFRSATLACCPSICSAPVMSFPLPLALWPASRCRVTGRLTAGVPPCRNEGQPLLARNAVGDPLVIPG